MCRVQMGLGAMYDGMFWEHGCDMPVLCPMVVQRRTKEMLWVQVGTVCAICMH